MKLMAMMLMFGSLLSAGVARAEPVPLKNKTNVRAVYQISGDRLQDGRGEGLVYLKKALEAYERLGVAQKDRKLVAVVHGDAGHWLLNDEAYARDRLNKEKKNPNAALVAELIERGVEVEMCSQTMARHGWKAQDLLPGVQIVPAAYPRVIDLQLSGYAHIVFDRSQGGES